MSNFDESLYEEHMEECEKFIEVLINVTEQPTNVDASIYCAVPNIDECDEPSVTAFVWNKNTEEMCANINYSSSDKIIHIEGIKRCSGEILPDQGTGSDIVKQLIKVGEEFRMFLKPGTKLILMIDSDQSKITVKGVTFELYWLYIFATGQSWYNSLGFEEDEYADNTEFITEFIDNREGNNPSVREEFEKIKRDLRDPNIPISTVEEYKKQLNKTIIRFNKYLLDGIKNGLIANKQFNTKFSEITYDYPVTMGGKKKRRRRKSKKGRKSRNKVTRKR